MNTQAQRTSVAMSGTAFTGKPRQPAGPEIASQGLSAGRAARGARACQNRLAEVWDQTETDLITTYSCNSLVRPVLNETTSHT